MKTEQKMTVEYSMWNTDYLHKNQCLKKAEYGIYNAKHRMTKMALTVFWPCYVKSNVQHSQVSNSELEFQML